MIKVTEKAGLKRLLSYPKAYKDISKLLEDLLRDYSEYCADGSIRAIGAIYFMECLNDFEDYKSLGLEQSLQNSLHEIIRNKKYCGYYIFNRRMSKKFGKVNSHKNRPQEEIIEIKDG
ncbi:MAG: recombinase family protein, partial [Oscillospiraceae bacterium]|nr:recombinase family protein [Oscillospiraceae bacterium]